MREKVYLNAYRFSDGKLFQLGIRLRNWSLKKRIALAVSFLLNKEVILVLPKFFDRAKQKETKKVK